MGDLGFDIGQSRHVCTELLSMSRMRGIRMGPRCGRSRTTLQNNGRAKPNVDQNVVITSTIIAHLTTKINNDILHIINSSNSIIGGVFKRYRRLDIH